MTDSMVDVNLVAENGVISWASESTHAVLDYEPGALVGVPLSRIMATIVTPAPQGESTSGVATLFDSHGGQVAFDITMSSPSPEEQQQFLYVTGRPVDVTTSIEHDDAMTEQTLRTVLDLSPDGLAVYRATRGVDGEIAQIHLAYINVAGSLGAGPAAMIGHEVRDLFPAVEYGLWRALVSAMDRMAVMSLRIRPARGLHLDSTIQPMSHTTALVTWRDISLQVQRERLLEEAYEETAEVRATLQTALDATTECFAVYRVDRSDLGEVTGLVVLLTNSAAQAAIGVDAEALLGLDMRDFFPEAEECGLWARILASIEDAAPTAYRVHLERDGEWFTSWDNTISPVGYDRLVVIWRDATAHEAALRRLSSEHDHAVHVATHDTLTGLPNRRLLHEALEDALAHADDEGKIVLVFVDLDGFKAINDRYGHAAGDAVLAEQGRRLMRLVRGHDTPARLGGDEFVLLLRHVNLEWSNERFFERARDLLHQPIQVGDVTLNPRVSMGMAIAEPGMDADALIAAADGAMYADKAHRRSAASRVPRQASHAEEPVAAATVESDTAGSEPGGVSATSVFLGLPRLDSNQ